VRSSDFLDRDHCVARGFW